MSSIIKKQKTHKYWCTMTNFIMMMSVKHTQYSYWCLTFPFTWQLITISADFPLVDSPESRESWLQPMLLSENFFKLLHLFLIAVSDLPITAFSKNYDFNHIYICTAFVSHQEDAPGTGPTCFRTRSGACAWWHPLRVTMDRAWCLDWGGSNISRGIVCQCEGPF